MTSNAQGINFVGLSTAIHLPIPKPDNNIVVPKNIATTATIPLKIPLA